MAGTGLVKLRTAVKNDGNLPRLVGYLEYAMALDGFDRLLSVVTPQELEAIDALIRGDEQYAIYVNLSRRFAADGQSSFRQAESAIEHDFARRGLNWMTALARVELAAMLAGFTDQESPFVMVRPNPYDMVEYEELVLDAMRSHLWALDADPVARNINRAGLSEESALAYQRRATLAMKLVAAVRKLAGPRMSPEQAREISVMEKAIAELDRTVREDVLQLGVSKRKKVYGEAPIQSR